MGGFEGAKKIDGFESGKEEYMHAYTHVDIDDDTKISCVWLPLK